MAVALAQDLLRRRDAYLHLRGDLPEPGPETRGTFQHHELTSFQPHDTVTTGTNDHTIDVPATCDTGCTLTPGFWKTHSRRGTAPHDEAWQLVGPDQEATVFFLAGMTWYDALWTPPAGNAYFILAHAWIAAEINVLNGTSAPPEVLDALIEAADLFALYTPADILADGKNSRIRRRMPELAGLLDLYNDSPIGPGHCTEDSGSTF